MRLDSHAAGIIDSLPDSEIQAKARNLPAHRYDWYTFVPKQPWPSPKPADFDTTVQELNVELSPSVPIPWEQWDTNAAVEQRVLHFSKEEILRIYAAASLESRRDGDGNGDEAAEKISKHDALLAHLWSLIISSRHLPPGTTSYLDLTFGVRARVSPPLPDSFLGSPICHVAISSPSPPPPPPPSSFLYQSTASSTTKSNSDSEHLSILAQRIRSHLGKFSHEEISWLLHDRASEVAPQRLWGACLGREHVLLTTWVRSGVHEVVFCEGWSPLWVEAVMPPLDGLVEIMEGPPSGEVRGDAGGSGSGSWIEEGVDVTVFLEGEAMERLLADERLWGGL
ncbi:hypothetical protein ONS96_003041 [Cadophora gregata f. sp. sojae]|nr:hypothetical protein ONS96_003041 [Cadophora gregata f. sp. sojae]